jgi:hypothetical protein
MSFFSWLRNLKSARDLGPARRTRLRTPRRGPAASCRPSLESLEDRCTPSAAFLGGHSQVQLLTAENSYALVLPNGTIHALPSGPIFGLLTAATPPQPVVPPQPIIPTSFQGFLGHSALELNINADGASITLPSDKVLVPPNPCLPGLLTAAGWDGQLDN